MIDTTITMGTWREPGGVAALSRQQMWLDAGQLAEHWRRSSLSADFWARYTARFVPAPAPAGRLRREHLEELLSYMLNELFENCAKFSAGPITAVHYDCQVGADAIQITVTNYITPERQAPFAAFVAELLAGDPEELYFARLEASAEHDDGGSGLGYLTMMKDYGIRFGFRFAPAAPGSVAVSVQAHVQLEEI